jgi:transcription elongation factor Elf1
MADVIDIGQAQRLHAGRKIAIDVVQASAVFRCPCGNQTAMLLPIFNTADQGTVACGKCQTIFSIEAL